MSYFYTTPFIIVAAVILGDIYCRDATYVRQSGSSDNWPTLPTWASNQKNATTPWPALGHRYNTNTQLINNNPTWVRPDQRQNVNRRQGSNNNFNTGSHYGQNQRGKSEPSVTQSQSSDVKDDELREFSATLLNKDVNNAAKYVTINLQSKTTSRSSQDEAPSPLLTIDKEALKISTIEKMLLLHNNYILESNANENYTPQEKIEENNLLDIIVNTPVMQHTRNFLIEKGKLGRDPKEFKDILREIWFNMYSRGGGRIGSSGFEHVFLAEIKKNQVSGLHNWIYFDEAERSNNANYLGYMKKLDLGNKGAILKYHFTFHGIDKPVGSMFIGTSPEFEMALYTTCFLLRADHVCPLKLNGNRFVIRTYTYRYRGKNMIGSAFPDI